MLHGQVKVADQLRNFVIRGNQRRCELVGVAGGVADTLNARNVGHILQQGGKVGQISRDARCTRDHSRAVGVDVLAQQRHFFHALVRQTSHFHQHVFKWAANLFAAGVRHHAVAAVFGASFHDADEGCGSLYPSRGQMVKFLYFGKADVYLGAILGGALV